MRVLRQSPIRTISISLLSPLFFLFTAPEPPSFFLDSENPPDEKIKKFKTLTREQAFTRIMELQKTKNTEDAVIILCQLLMLLLDNDDRIGKCLDHLNRHDETHAWSNRITFGIMFTAIIVLNGVIITILSYHIGW